MGSPRGFFCTMTGSLAWRRPRRVVAQGSASASARLGMLTLSSHGAVPGCPNEACAMTDSTTLRAARAAASTCAQPLCCTENAIAGTPNRKPSIAAATVPE